MQQQRLSFYKFHGAGNDFILIDNRKRQDFSTEEITLMCHRRLGIGADGFILLENDDTTDFFMRYFNSDGKEASLCGNGSRCVVAFAHFLNIIKDDCQFKAFDGMHHATVRKMNDHLWNVALEMSDVDKVTIFEDGYFTDTGSPHFISFLEDVKDTDVVTSGKKIRYDKRFPEGCNVNFAAPYSDGLFVRTYERGVEDETLSCGTGVTATALTFAHKENFTEGKSVIPIYTKGGKLKVHFILQDKKFNEIILEGPATFVFEGKY